MLKDVPAGNIELVAWHKSAGFIRRSMTVPPTGSVNVLFEMPLGQTEIGSAK